MIRIDRCVCMERSFEELKRIAREQRCDFDELRRRTGCGMGCGLCVPYVKAMLRPPDRRPSPS
jgi:bacterioferritin-associated ferredoxin